MYLVHQLRLISITTVTTFFCMYTVIWYSTEYTTVQCNTVQYGTVQYSTLYYTVQYCTVHYITQYSIVKCSTVQCMVPSSFGHVCEDLRKLRLSVVLELELEILWKPTSEADVVLQKGLHVILISMTLTWIKHDTSIVQVWYKHGISS